MSLKDDLSKAKALLDDDTKEDKDDPNPEKAIKILTELQNSVHQAALFSNNESLSDLQTSSLPLLAVEYHLAKAFLKLDMRNSSTPSLYRQRNVLKGTELFYLFLNKCDLYEKILNDQVKLQYQALLIVHESQNSHQQSNEDDTDSSQNNLYHCALPPQSRDEKIQNFKANKAIETQIKHLNAKVEQRSRLSLSPNDCIDGHDHESLFRKLATDELNMYALDAISEIYSGNFELQMLNMAVKIEKDRSRMNSYRHGHGQDHGHGHFNRNDNTNNLQSQKLPQSTKPTQLTHVTKDPLTGQLLFQKEEIKSTIFRPSWNQPTMSLDEYAEKEMQEAKLRAERQAGSEAHNKTKPRKYEYLQRDGLEDDAKLVDASAKIDREWDDWKDENPKGSGNKMGDVGDRNF